MVLVGSIFLGVQAQPQASFRRFGIWANDTLRMAQLGRYGLERKYGTYDTAIVRAREYLALAQQLHYPAVELHARIVLADATMTKDERAGMEMMYDVERRLQQVALSPVPPAKYVDVLSAGDAPLDEAGFSEWVKGVIYQSFSMIYWLNRSGRSQEFNTKALEIFRKLGAGKSLSVAYLNIGLRSTDADSAMVAFDSAYLLARRKGHMEDIMADALSNKVNLLKLKNRWEDYLKTVKELDSLGARLSTPDIGGWNQIKYGEYFRHKNQPDSAILHFKNALQVAKAIDYAPMAYWSSRYLYETYRSMDMKDNALVYLEVMTQASAKAQNMDEMSKFWDLDFQKNVELKAELEEAKAFRSRVKLGVIISAALLTLVFAIAYYRYRLSRRRPLNALTSDFNRQLEEAARKGDLDEVRALAGVIRSNLESISEHGRRADALMWNMLQNTRPNFDQKDPTDLNASEVD